jgi:hypothetical protein
VIAGAKFCDGRSFGSARLLARASQQATDNERTAQY